MFTVQIHSLTTDHMILAIKAVRSMHQVYQGTPLGLREAKALADTARYEPKTQDFLTLANETSASAVAAYLAAHGFDVSITESTVPVPESLLANVRNALAASGDYALMNAVDAAAEAARR
jgi:hypothetical protein